MLLHVMERKINILYKEEETLMVSIGMFHDNRSVSSTKPLGMPLYEAVCLQCYVKISIFIAP